VRVVAILLVLTTLARADAPRDAIERARELEAKLAYDEALAIIDSAIASGQSDRARLVELHLIAGRLAAGLDRAKVAEDHFAVVLALDPSRTLSDDTSPKIAVPFTVARTKTAPLEVTLAISKTEVGVTAGPLVAGIAVKLGDGTTRTAQARLMPRPPGEVVEVRALDQYGNVLWIGIPPVEPVIEPPKVTHTEQPAIYARWTTWAALTGVALATGGIAAWRFDSAQNEFDTKRKDGMTDFSDLQAIEDRGKRWSLRREHQLRHRRGDRDHFRRVFRAPPTRPGRRDADDGRDRRDLLTIFPSTIP
jgi:hypothetical protein